MIKTSFDPEADAFSAHFAPPGTPSVETREVAPGVLLDFDAAGSAIGVEVLSIQPPAARVITAHCSKKSRPPE